jgi:hypothetical protein
MRSVKCGGAVKDGRTFGHHDQLLAHCGFELP